MTKFILYCVQGQQFNNEGNLIDCKVSPVRWRDVCEVMEKLYNYNGTVPNFYFDDMLPKALLKEVGLSIRFSMYPEVSLVKPTEEVFFVDKNSVVGFSEKYKVIGDMIAGTLVVQGYDVIVSNLDPNAVKQDVTSRWKVHKRAIETIRKTRNF